MRPLEFICRVGKPLGVVLFATGVLPPGRAGHLLFPQSRSYLVRPHASVGILEYPLDYPCCFLVHDQLIVVIRGLAIPQGSIGAAVQSRLCPGPYGRTDFAGIVPAVKLVHDVFQRRYVVILVGGVYAVIDRDIADILHRKVNFCKMPHLQMVAAQPGQILGDDHINFARFDVVQHTVKIWTVEIKAAPSVVHIHLHHQKIMLFGVLGQHGLLRPDTLAVPLGHIVFRQAAVEGCP